MADTPTVNVRIRLTEAAQRAEATAGRNAAAIRVLAFDDASDPAWPDLVALADIDQDGAIRLDLADMPQPAIPTTIAAVLAIHANRLDQQVAQRQKAAEEYAGAALQLAQEFVERLDDDAHELPAVVDLTEWLVAQTPQSLAAGIDASRVDMKALRQSTQVVLERLIPGYREAQIAVQHRRSLQRAAEWLGGLDEPHRGLPEVQAFAQGLAEQKLTRQSDNEHPMWVEVEGERAALAAVAAAVEKERHDAQVAEAVAWIDAHGSSRLKRIVAAGLLEESGGVYRDELLAFERPGGWAYDTADGRHKDAEIRNPSEEALDLLEEARRTVPEAKLVFRKLAGDRSVAIAVAPYRDGQIVLWPKDSGRRLTQSGSEGGPTA